MRCAIYARVSTKRDEQRNSLENQIAFTSEVAKSHGWTVTEKYIDNGVSGTTFEKRDDIQRLMRDAKAKKFDVIIAKSVSRFGRDTLECLKAVAELEKLGLRLMFPEDYYDSEKNKNKMTFQLKAILAEDESARMSARIKIGIQVGARKGKYQASLTAFGYKKNADGKLELDSEYSTVVREMFDMYLYKGWGWFRIANHLSTQKIPTPRRVSGGKNAGLMWQESSVRVILENPIYTGKLVQHREEVTDFATKCRKKVDPEQQIVVENSHPAIITDEEHIAVLEKMRSKDINKSNGQESVFAHIACCADCGKGMTYRKDRMKRESGSYVCIGYVKHTSSYCSSHIVGYRKLIESVTNDLRELITNNVKLERLYRVAGGELELHQNTYSKELQNVSKRLGKLDTEFSTLLSLFQQKVIGIEQFKAANDNIQAEQSRLAARKIELETLIESKKDTERYLLDFQRQVNKIAKLDIDNEQVLKHVIQRLIHKIEVHADGSIKIIYNIARPASLGA